MTDIECELARSDPDLARSLGGFGARGHTQFWVGLSLSAVLLLVNAQVFLFGLRWQNPALLIISVIGFAGVLWPCRAA